MATTPTLLIQNQNQLKSPIQFSHQIRTILNQDNHLLWKSQILPVLRGYGLVGFIDGSKSPPESTINDSNGVSIRNPALDEWEQQDQLILAWIFSSISPSILAQVSNCQTAAALWQCLDQMFVTQSMAKVLDLKLQLQTSKKGGLHCYQYLQHMQSLADRLRSIGTAVSDQDLVLYTLQGLGSEYENFVTALSLRYVFPSMAELHGLLLAHEARLQTNLKNLSSQTTVHLTQSQPTVMGHGTNTSQSTTSNASDQMILYTTGVPSKFNGGYQTNSGRSNSNRGCGSNRGRGRGHQYPNQTQNQPQCQICEKWGHVALNCYHRFDIRYTGTPQSPVTAQTSSQPQALIAEPSQTPTTNWFLDSGATTHVTPDINNLSFSQAYNGSEAVHIGNGSGLQIAHKGTAFIPTTSKPLFLDNMLHVPQITKNLISVSQLLKDNDIIIEFLPNSCLIKDQKTRQTLLHGTLLNGLYQLALTSSSPTVYQALHTTVASSDLWHYRLGHCSTDVVDRLRKTNQISFNNSGFSVCSDCNKAKAHKLPFSVSSSTSSKPLELVHSDLWGPSPVVSDQGNRYYVLFVDDFSRLSWIFPCSTKSDVPKLFALFKLKAENLLGTSIKCFQCDGGTEFKPIMTQFPEITFRISCPYTPEQNGHAERKHRHITELSLATMFHASIPLHYWDIIFPSIVFTINRLPSTHNQCSPFELLFHHKPDYRFLKVLGCACFPLLRPYVQHKLQPRSEKCVFLGYSSLHKGYLCLHLPTNKIYTSRHVLFDEHDFPFTSQQHESPADSISSLAPADTSLTILPSSSTVPTSSPPPPSSPSLPLLSASANLPSSSNTHSMLTRNKTKSLKPKNFPNHQVYNTTSSVTHPTDPISYSQAVKHQHWRSTVAAELDALAQNSTWVLVEPPPNANVIGAKWLFKTKFKPNGQVERYKARLVAKGFTQQEGIDYFETFSPVVKPTTIRVVLSIALSSNWCLHQLDVNNAFLHGELEESVFMEQPPGFSDPLYPHHVCKLNKALYGLKQAPRAWFFKLKSFLTSHHFKCSQSDNSLFTLHTKTATIFVLIYVDDIIITGSDSVAIKALIHQLDCHFSIKDLGELHYFLGIEVTKTGSQLHLSQRRYLTTIMDRASMLTAKSCRTPMQAGLQPSRLIGSALSNPHLFRSIVGALQYATITRPDLTFAVNKVSQFKAEPTDFHWSLVKRILRYVQGTLHHGLVFNLSSDLNLNAYCDADWAGCPDDRRSTMGFAIFMGPNMVSWSSKKQTTVSKSSTEAEYRSIAVATQELLWLTSLFSKLGQPQSTPPTLWCDNLGATFLASNPVFHARTKHIELDFHFVRERVSSGQLKIQFICSSDQIGDMFTKSLPKARFLLLCDKLNVFSHSSSLRGRIEEQSEEELDNSSDC